MIIYCLFFAFLTAGRDILLATTWRLVEGWEGAVVSECSTFWVWDRRKTLTFKGLDLSLSEFKVRFARFVDLGTVDPFLEDCTSSFSSSRQELVALGDFLTVLFSEALRTADAAAVALRGHFTRWLHLRWEAVSTVADLDVGPPADSLLPLPSFPTPFLLTERASFLVAGNARDFLVSHLTKVDLLMRTPVLLALYNKTESTVASCLQNTLPPLLTFRYTKHSNLLYTPTMVLCTMGWNVTFRS